MSDNDLYARIWKVAAIVVCTVIVGSTTSCIVNRQAELANCPGVVNAACIAAPHSSNCAEAIKRCVSRSS